MKPALALLATAAGIAAGCSSMPGMAKPKWTLEPRVDFGSIDGDLSMQSPSTSGPVDNPKLDAAGSFGITNRDTNLGLRLSLGDGHSGFSLDAIEQDHNSVPKQMQGDFGHLTAPHTVPIETDINAYRMSLAYHAMLLSFDQIENVKLRAGLGVSVDHESLRLESTRSDKSQQQIIHAHDAGVPMARARVDGEYDVFGLRADFGWMNGDFGDSNGTMMDLEVSARYRVSEKVTLVGGYRRIDLPLKGRVGDLAFDLDLTTESWFLGVAYTF